MNEKEISEIRRRFRPDRSGISHIRGCYVNENREIVSQFDQSLGLMSQEESEKLLAILRRTLSGTLGKNLADITFSTQQVVDSEEHRLLMALQGAPPWRTKRPCRPCSSGSSPPSPWRGTISSSWPTTPMTSPTGPKTGSGWTTPPTRCSPTSCAPSAR